MKIICEIPVREGSKRIPNKNIIVVNGKRIVEYIIDVAVKSKVFDEIWINTNSKVIIDEYNKETLIHNKKILIYKRPEKLCSDTAKSDDFNYDFATNTESDVLVMLNPVCPLLKSSSVKKAVKTFIDQNEYDTLISCSKTQMQAFVDGISINFDSSKALGPSQENREVKILNWAITIWNTRKLIDRYVSHSSCVLGNKRMLFDITPLESIKLSNEDDLNLVKEILSNNN
jgi:CMP-N,N'-diacetyllegionaminic acid synthase